MCKSGNNADGCVINDMRIFMLSLFSAIGWITFTVSMVVAFQDWPELLKTVNSLTLVHYSIAIAGLPNSLLGMWYSSNLNAVLGFICVFLSSAMLVVAGGSANDFGRLVFYCNTDKLATRLLVNATNQCEPANYPAIVGGVLIILCEMLKLLALHFKKTRMTGAPRRHVEKRNKQELTGV